MRQFPKFKYHPEPLDNKVFIISDEECPCCGHVTGFSYVGPFYSFKEVEGICPWCIDSGEAAEKYDASFVDEDELEENLSKEKIDLLTKRTPGFFFPQYDSWPVHCDDYCRIVGFIVGDKKNSCLSKYSEDFKNISEKLAIDKATVVEKFCDHESALRFYFFQCVTCSYEKIDADYE